MLQRTDKKSAAAYCDEFRGPRTPRPAPYRLRNSRSPRAPPQRHGGSHAARASRMVAAPDHAIVRAATTARIPLRAAYGGTHLARAAITGMRVRAMRRQGEGD